MKTGNLPLVIFISALLGTLTFSGSSRVTLQAQDEETEVATRDRTARYVTPPATKSVEIGNFYFKRKKYNAALSRYQEAVKTDPAYAPAYLGLGRVYEKIGLKMKALDAYRKYLDTLPSAKQADEAKEAHRAIERLERGRHTPKT